MYDFKPQGTTMNTYAKIEQKLFDDFVSFGYDRRVAQAIAHSFTQYVLGYLSDAEAVTCLVGAGADENLAKKVVETFRLSKDKVPMRSASPTGPDHHSTTAL